MELIIVSDFAGNTSLRLVLKELPCIVFITMGKKAEFWKSKDRWGDKDVSSKDFN